MHIDLSVQHLPVYEALASEARLRILRMLASRPMNVKELAEETGLSSSIITMHVKKLEQAELIVTRMVPGKGAAKKVCSLHTGRIVVDFPPKTELAESSWRRTEVSVGHYTDYEVKPTCGLATPQRVIGHFDDPRFFLDPERVNAKILWFGRDGFLEYRVPNYLLANEVPDELQISLELGSEAPFSDSHWPSDITFFLNGVALGTWTSPGDFGDVRGKYTPDWWKPYINQYGLLKIISVTNEGTFIDGLPLSDVKLAQLQLGRPDWRFRLAVEPDAANIGGLTLYGTGFGNYNQDIVFALRCHKIDPPAAPSS